MVKPTKPGKTAPPKDRIEYDERVYDVPLTTLALEDAHVLHEDGTIRLFEGFYMLPGQTVSDSILMSIPEGGVLYLTREAANEARIKHPKALRGIIHDVFWMMGHEPFKFLFTTNLGIASLVFTAGFAFKSLDAGLMTCGLYFVLILLNRVVTNMFKGYKDKTRP